MLTPLFSLARFKKITLGLVQKQNKMNVLKSTREYKLIASAGCSGYAYDGVKKEEKA